MSSASAAAPPFPEDPCLLLDREVVAKLLGHRRVRGSVNPHTYGCVYSNATRVEVLAPGQLRSAELGMLVFEGDEARRWLLQTSELLQPRSEGDQGELPTAERAAVQLSPDTEAMMGLPLAAFYGQWAELVGRLLEPRSEAGAADLDAASSGGDAGFTLRALRCFHGLGDIAAYFAPVLYGYDVSHVLQVVEGDRLFAFQITGQPAFDRDNQQAFDALVSVAQSALNAPRVRLDIAIEPLGALRSVTPAPGLTPMEFARLRGQPIRLPFDAITNNMTYAEVVDLLGFPGVPEPFITNETWVWRQGQSQVDIGFKSDVSSSLGRRNLVADSDLGSRATGVVLGMTTGEVEHILGRPSEIRTSYVLPVVWRHPRGGCITVYFEDGISAGGWGLAGGWPEEQVISEP